MIPGETGEDGPVRGDPGGAGESGAVSSGELGGSEQGFTQTDQSGHDPLRSGGSDGRRDGSVRGDLPPPEREQALGFVLRHPLGRGRRPVFLTALLLLGSVLVAPALLLGGYSYRLGRSVVLGREQPPAYDDWAKLLMDGIRLTIVVSIPTLAWAVGSLVVVSILLLVVPASSVASPMVTGLLGAGLLWFVGTYVVAFVGSDSVVGAFIDGRARTLRSDPGFLRSWLVVVAFTAVLLAAVALSVSPLFVVLTGGFPSPVAVVLAPLSLGVAALVLSYGTLVGATHAGYVYYGAQDRGALAAPEAYAEHDPDRAVIGRRSE